MKKTPLKKETKTLKRSGFKQKLTTPLKRSKLRVVGHSTVAEQKKEIQFLLRQIVIQRDKGCILRNIRYCGGELGNEGVIFQADHLISRSNSATFADSRLVVCVCKRCHGWKSVGSNKRKAEYDQLVKPLLSKERQKLWEKCEKDLWMPKRTGSNDWKLFIIALKQELLIVK